MAHIIWTLPAMEDLDEIAEYIALNNRSAAKAVVRRITDEIKQLETFPNIGFTPPHLVGTRYRQLVKPPCHIYYRVEDEGESDEPTVYIIYIMRDKRQFRLIDLVRRDM